MWRHLLITCALGPWIFCQEFPTVVVTADNTRIDRSCRVRIPKGLVLRDEDGDGVLHIVGDGIKVEFEHDATLQGADTQTEPCDFVGAGITITDRKDVELIGVRVAGFKCGIRARRALALAVRGGDLSGNFRQKLLSTPEAEHAGDWLSPHSNDAQEWVTRYGAALCIEESERVSVRGLRVRRGQNGILFDRVSDAVVCDNDVSFLSGWGLALWRSSGNTISRNAFDFCVRGYSHGVYNRGQDSAGILMFEQCNNNTIVENSATHGGDGIFGFGGQESLNGSGRTGNNANLIAGNDLSYAAAHGLEMTFSFDNVITQNRFVKNAICGVWGGYSQDTTLVGNTFEANGDRGYGLERGGINIEHGRGNAIVRNTFRDNACGVHLWDDDDRDLLAKPWCKKNHRGSRDNVVSTNSFAGDRVALHLRKTKDTHFHDNALERVATQVERDELSNLIEDRPPKDSFGKKSWKAPGETTPVGRRTKLAGREHIVMTAWGPWDHEAPLCVPEIQTGSEHVFQLLGILGPVETRLSSPDVILDFDDAKKRLTLRGRRPGAHTYRLFVAAKNLKATFEGLLVSVTWDVTVFPWTHDPREDAVAWRKEAQSASACSTTLSALRLVYGMGGPKELGLSKEISASSIPANRFGTIAKTKLSLPPGRWRIKTSSDDGIRVTANGQRIIDDWTWHAPKSHEAILTVKDERPIAFEVEHFELDGYAVLTLDVEPISPERK